MFFLMVAGLVLAGDPYHTFPFCCRINCRSRVTSGRFHTRQLESRGYVWIPSEGIEMDRTVALPNSHCDGRVRHADIVVVS